MTKKQVKIGVVPVRKAPLGQGTGALLNELRALIDSARKRAAQQVNIGLVTLYWHIGARIKTEILKEERAEYGKHVLETLGRQLTLEYGRGFDRTALTRMVQFFELFPDWKIVATLSHKLGWSHFIELLPMNIELKLERFKAEHKGQMELYLKWLDKYDRKEGEESPIGLILCASKSVEEVELLSLDAGGIRVAEYVTEDLPKPALATKLHNAIKNAKEHLSSKQSLIEQ